MNTMNHDYSAVERLDEHFATRRDQELQLAAEAARTKHAAQMAALNNERIRKAGIAALLLGCGVGVACLGASFMIKPTGAERVVYTPGPERVVTRDVPGRERIIHDAPLPPHRPVAETPLAPPYAPRTPEEKPFTEKQEFRDANYHGIIIKSVDGRSISFADGKNSAPCKLNEAAGKCEEDPTKAFDTDPYINDLGMCVPDKKYPDAWRCTVLHNGQEIPIMYKSVEQQHPASSSCLSTNGLPILEPRCQADNVHSAINMVNVRIDLGYGSTINATVDTGCQYPIALPGPTAWALLENNLAFRAGSSQSVMADGHTSDIEIIMIRTVVVEGRTLTNVEAAVSPNSDAMVLLGLGALNQLGTYKIEGGRIVFS